MLLGVRAEVWVDEDIRQRSGASHCVRRQGAQAVADAGRHRPPKGFAVVNIPLPSEVGISRRVSRKMTTPRDVGKENGVIPGQA